MLMTGDGLHMSGLRRVLFVASLGLFVPVLL